MLRGEVGSKDSFRKSSLKVDPRVIVALDLEDIDAVRTLVSKIGNSVSTFKVGMRLFTKYGPSLIKELKDKGYNIFLDMKYHDIPNTVETACRAAAQLGISMLTIHCLGGKAMCRAAVRGVREGSIKSGNAAPILLGVTILTSMDEVALKEIGIKEKVESEVINLAKMALEEGVNGIVCSAQEVAKLKSSIKQDFIAVTPGIRLSNDSVGDQKRIASPDVAISDGADYLVIGRPVYAADDPTKALEKIYNKISKVK